MNRGKLSLLMVMLLLSIMFSSGCRQVPAETGDPVEGDKPQPPVEEAVDEEKLHKKVQPVSVSIDNHASARPQSGLQEATIVYEFLVEGGITRFLAVFDLVPEENFIIGPVRSIRPYFAQQAAEFNGLLAHGGYCQSFAERIKEFNIKHITGSKVFYRDSSRSAPHNLYTDITSLYQAAENDENPVEYSLTLPALPAGYDPGAELDISYSARNKVSYMYHEESQSYLRFINQTPHTDRDSGEQYRARRVILHRTRHTNIPNSQLVDIELSGEGEGELFEEGRRYAIRWVKEGSKTHYYFSDGTPVDLTYGNTWIQVVR